MMRDVAEKVSAANRAEWDDLTVQTPQCSGLPPLYTPTHTPSYRMHIHKTGVSEQRRLRHQ
jgi:hypothetical protein